MAAQSHATPASSETRTPSRRLPMTTPPPTRPKPDAFSSPTRCPGVEVVVDGASVTAPATPSCAATQGCTRNEARAESIETAPCTPTSTPVELNPARAKPGPSAKATPKRLAGTGGVNGADAMTTSRGLAAATVCAAAVAGTVPRSASAPMRIRPASANTVEPYLRSDASVTPREPARATERPGVPYAPPMRGARTTAILPMMVLLAGCGAPGEAPEADAAEDAHPLGDVVLPTDDGPVAVDAWRADASDVAVVTDVTGATDAPRDVSTARADAGCPSEMALVRGRACVDRWEEHLEMRDLDGGIAAWSPYLNPGTRWVRAVSSENEVPQGYISGVQARDACANAGKRLCALDDWLAACRGPASLVYPSGNSYVHRRCNEGRTPHPVVQFYGTSVGVFTFERMNDPGINQQADTVARTGAFTGCVSPGGFADMVGNLHEWIDDPNGTFKGGFYVDAEINGHGCLYTTTAHDLAYHDYSTGFRCCADPR